MFSEDYEKGIKATLPVTILLLPMLIVLMINNHVAQQHPMMADLAMGFVLAAFVAEVAIGIQGMKKKDLTARRIKLMVTPMYVALILILVLDVIVSSLK